MSVHDLIFAAASASVQNWFANINSAGSDVIYGACLEGSSNTIASGSIDTDAFIVKYGPYGDVAWQKLLSGSGSERFNKVCAGSSGASYVTGYTSTSSTGTTDALTAKYDSSGVLQWQRILGSSGYSTSGKSIACDSSENVYVCASLFNDTSSVYTTILAKYNSSGSLQWQRQLSGSNNTLTYCVAIDGSGNVFVTGRASYSGLTTGSLYIAKYDSSGSIQWQKLLNDARSVAGMAINSNGIYLASQQDVIALSKPHLYVTSFDLSGNWQSTNDYSRVSFSIYAGGIAVDESGNIYSAGTSSADSSILTIKQNSSGTFQWARLVATSGGSTTSTDIWATNSNVCTVGYDGTATSGVIAKVPTNGTITGTYGIFSYGIMTNLGVGSKTDTISSGSLTDASSSLTDAAGSLASSTATLTSSIYYMR